MAKKIVGLIKLQVPAGKANPSPPIGPALGQRGLNIMEFCKAFNAQTQKVEPGLPLPVVITAYADKSFSFIIKTPPTTVLIKKAAGIESGSPKPHTDKVGKILVPVEEVVEMKGGQKHMSERKFFPGYVLVEMEMNDDTWHLVKNTNKVTGFVGGTATKPAPIPEKEVEAIMQQMREGVEKPKPKVLFEVGEMVRVKDGPFTDFQGTVEDVNYEKSRLRVAVTIFGRSTPVELEFGQVEKA